MSHLQLYGGRARDSMRSGINRPSKGEGPSRTEEEKWDGMAIVSSCRH